MLRVGGAKKMRERERGKKDGGDVVWVCLGGGGGRGRDELIIMGGYGWMDGWPEK